MKTLIKSTFITAFFFTISLAAFAQQATLTIENNSMRSMTVKIMQGSSKGSLFNTVIIGAHGKETVYFSETGYYFTKTKAVFKGRDAVFQKGKPFKVVNDETGYSEMTLTFTIKESAVPQVMGGQQITKTEFDQN